MLISAALIGSSVGMALGAAYMAGGMAQAATDYSRANRIAQAADGHYSETVLQREAGDPMVLRLARTQGAVRMEEGSNRQLRLLTARLDRPRTKVDSARELDCLTQAVYFEARGETPRGQAAVAQVVLNRVKHPAFPKTVCGVVFQGAARHTGCQFSFACDGSMRRSREATAWSRARKVAARAITGVALPEIGAATHFHTAQVSPSWGPSMRRVAQVGLHVFYRFNPRGYKPAPSGAGDVMLASLPAGPDAPVSKEFQLAAALVGQASDAVELAAPAATALPEGKAAAPEAPAAAPKPADAPPAGLSKTAADAGQVAQNASAATAS